tara:strand:+ start:541 stop:699 length:159 start_codon:yes stop_codon:yes gene_type:complete
MKIRVKELSEALNIDSDDILAVCVMLNITATSRITSLTIEDAKRITDFYENK